MNYGIAELLTNPYVSRILAGILGATFIFFVVISVILLYHWRKYEPSNGKVIFASFIYSGGAVFLFGGAFYYLFLFIK